MPAVQRQPSPPSPLPLPTPAPAPVPHRQEEDALLTPPWLPPPDGMALEPALEWAAAVAKVVTAAAALLASSPWQPPSLLLSPRGAPSEQPAPNRGSSRGRASATAPSVRPLVWRLQTRRPIADFLFRRNLNPKGATRETGDLIKASMGFTSVSRSYYYLRRRSPGPPFPPDHRQAGERGAIRLYLLSYLIA